MADINLGVGGANSAVAGGYDIANSLKLESDNAEYIDNRHYTAGNRRTWTLSFWIKRTELGTTQKPYDAGNAASIAFLSTDKIQIENSNLYLVTNRVFRDTSAWYHIVLLNDSTQSTASNRAKLWINGVQETSFSNETYMAQNQEGNMNSATSVSIGGGGGAHVNGYMAELFFVDGQALAPTDFGEFDEDSGIWKPKEYDGTLSGTSIKLDFSNSAALWEDSSGLTGNGTTMSGNNITAADQATDTPTNNFCTFNPLMTQNNPPTISEGAMKSTGGGGTWNQTWGNIGVKNGKWYYEFKVANSASTGYFGASTTPAEGSSTTAASIMYNTSFMFGAAARIDYYYFENGSQVSNESTGWGTISTNDVIGIALDLDSATKTFTAYKNGTALSGTLSQPVALPTNMQDEFIFPLYVQYENRQDEANFGGYTISSISTPASDENGYGNFEYAPPSGYYALCTKNLAEYG